MNHEPAPLHAARQALSICNELGFAGAGIADASSSEWGESVRAWLAAGRHGSMAYLARNVEARLDPGRVLAGARSVIMVADQYAEREACGEGPQEYRRAGSGDRVHGDGPQAGGTVCTGRIARYARGRDYHTVIKKRLHALCDRMRDSFPDAAFRAFVDTAPVLEREYAARAGLGWVGKHTLIIHPRRGSWMLLGGVLTTLELEPTPEVERTADHCGTCTRCIDACPTGAISPYSVDASRCISYLTIERRLPIEPEFFAPMGDWLFGCDACQDVCPHNSARAGRSESGSEAHARSRPEYAPRRDGFGLLEVLGWSEADRRAAFEGSSLKRATLAMMKRNALIVAGNLMKRGRDEELLGRIGEVARDPAEPEVVRKTAENVLAAIVG